MKKVLSVLCMAVLAGGLIFSSCTSKHTITVKSNNDAWGTVTGGGSYNDQEVATLLATPNAGYYFVKWQDNSTENPRTITVTQDETWTAFFEPIPVVNVTFNNSTWNAASVEGAYFAGQHAWDVYAEQTADNYPAADIAMFTGTNTGSFNDQVDAESGYLSSRGSEFGWVDYYKESYLYDGNGQHYGDWWAKAATVNVISFDATSMMMAASVSATLFDANNALVEGAGINAAPTATLDIDMRDIHLSTPATKNSLNKKVSGKLSVAR